MTIFTAPDSPDVPFAALTRTSPSRTVGTVGLKSTRSSFIRFMPTVTARSVIGKSIFPFDPLPPHFSRLQGELESPVFASYSSPPSKRQVPLF